MKWWINMRQRLTKRFWILLTGILFIFSGMLFAEESGKDNAIENIEFSTLPGGDVSIRVRLSEPMKNPPAGFLLNNPSRIALDFPKINNGLSKNNLAVDQGVLKSIVVAQAKERTRMVFNLSKNVAYNTVMSGSDVIVTLHATELATTNSVTKFAEPVAGIQAHSVKNVDFMRGVNGEGRVMVDLSDSTTGINIKRQGKTIVVDLINTELPESLQRRLNVTNFNTPVVYVDAMKQGKMRV